MTTEFQFPAVYWASEKVAPQLAGRAAEYVHPTRTLLLNWDFQSISELIEHFKAVHKDEADVLPLISGCVHQAFELHLTDAVCGGLAMKKMIRWSDADLAMGMSKEALTLVATHFTAIRSIATMLIAEQRKKMAATE